MAEPIVIQQTFEGLGVPPRPAEVLGDKPVAFGRVVMPYYFQLDQADYAGVDADAVESVQPDELRQLLLPNNGRGKFVVDSVALNATDFETVPRSVPAFIEKVTNRAERANSAGSVDGRRARAAQSAIDALQTKQAAMQRRVPNLTATDERLATLAKEAKATGYAHVPGMRLYNLAWSARYGDFVNVLDIAGREAGWTQSDAELASRALDVRLFFDKQKRVGNWRSMLELTSEHNAKVLELYGSRLTGVAYQIGRIKRHAQRPA